MSSYSEDPTSYCLFYRSSAELKSSRWSDGDLLIYLLGPCCFICHHFHSGSTGQLPAPVSHTPRPSVRPGLMQTCQTCKHDNDLRGGTVQTKRHGEDRLTGSGSSLTENQMTLELLICVMMKSCVCVCVCVCECQRVE